MDTAQTIKTANITITQEFSRLSKSDQKLVESLRISDIAGCVRTDVCRGSFSPLKNNPKRRIVAIWEYRSGVTVSLMAADYAKNIPDRGLDSRFIAFVPTSELNG